MLKIITSRTEIVGELQSINPSGNDSLIVRFSDGTEVTLPGLDEGFTHRVRNKGLAGCSNAILETTGQGRIIQDATIGNQLVKGSPSGKKATQSIGPVRMHSPKRPDPNKGEFTDTGNVSKETLEAINKALKEKAETALAETASK